MNLNKHVKSLQKEGGFFEENMNFKLQMEQRRKNRMKCYMNSDGVETTREGGFLKTLSLLESRNDE